MVSTIHIRTSQNLSLGGRGRKILFFGGGVSNGFQKERGGESVVANWVQRWHYWQLTANEGELSEYYKSRGGIRQILLWHK